MSDERPAAALAPETDVVPLPVRVYHVTLFDGDDLRACAAVVRIDGVEAGGTVRSCGQCDVLVPGEWTTALGAHVVVDVVAVAAGFRALFREYQLHPQTISVHFISSSLSYIVTTWPNRGFF